MLNAALKALSQMFSPPFRTVLLKSIGLALLLIVLLGFGLYRLLIWLAAIGEGWAQNAFNLTTSWPLSILAWMISVLAGLGILVGSVFLMPAVTALVASFFADDIAAEVERTYYPDEPVGTALPFPLFAGFGAVIFFFATAYLLGREYFLLAAMRFRPAAEAKRLRKLHGSTVFLAGMFIAAFVSIPIVNLATPLFGTAFMVHMHKRLARQTPLIART